MQQTNSAENRKKCEKGKKGKKCSTMRYAETSIINIQAKVKQRKLFNVERVSCLYEIICVRATVSAIDSKLENSVVSVSHIRIRMPDIWR